MFKNLMTAKYGNLFWVLREQCSKCLHFRYISQLCMFLYVLHKMLFQCITLRALYSWILWSQRYRQIPSWIKPGNHDPKARSHEKLSHLFIKIFSWVITKPPHTRTKMNILIFNSFQRLSRITVTLPRWSLTLENTHSSGSQNLWISLSS